MTMEISLAPVRLDTDDGDAEGVLVFREGRLLAVASRLSDVHARLAGRLYVEAVFGPRDIWIGNIFDGEDDLRQWAAAVDLPPATRPVIVQRI